MPRISVASPEQWATACSLAFVPLRVESTGERFSASLWQSALSNEVTLTRVVSGASAIHRDASVIAAHPREDILLSIHRSGTGSVRQHGRLAPLRPDTAAMYDASSPYVLTFPSRMSETVLQVPRSSVTATGHSFHDMTARPLPATPALRALTALADAASPSAGHHSPLESNAVAHALIDLIVSALTEPDTSASASLSSELLLPALKGYVDEHFADPALTPGALAAEFHVSLRLVQKLFATEGDSPAAYIRHRRLTHAHTMLTGGASVAHAAHQSGYLDVDSFARAFKHLHGRAPSAIQRRL